MTHAFYILTAYTLTTLTILSLIAWTWMDGRARRRELAELEASGLRRRSAAAPAGTPSP
ncbi:heme exporter protein CcmD [Affinirhizobium pseudoryzae]|jgi:heme exporter protein D|uniref:heme exporter protein CcmD n=1 Tax=Allorhizobium pseudoryzae TaxID=379684 RepID=UPI0013EC75A6|nr:heme exporter protein CcmD [Allorhizobium pseudoryzae]